MEAQRRLALVPATRRLRPGSARVVDLASYMRTLPGGELDTDYRPDGVHLTNEASAKLAKDWLADEVLRVYRDSAISRTPMPVISSLARPGRR